MKDSRQLEVWDHSHQLALAAYRATGSFPTEEACGLKSQMRRCATSIPTNIAEGCGRRTDGDFRRFLRTAMGSASELEYLLLLSEDLQLLNRDHGGALILEPQRAKKMLASFIRRPAYDMGSAPSPADSR